MDSKKRTINFQAKEEKLLIDLVKKYLDIIENKKTDSVSSKQKHEAWMKIEQEFNPHNEVFRSAMVLKNKYDNLKKTTKKRAAEEMKYCRGTGGGPAKKFKLTEVDEQIRGILGTQLTGLTAKFDDDAMFSPPTPSQNMDSDKQSSCIPSTSKGVIIEESWFLNNETNIEIVEPINVEKNIEPEVKIYSDWSDVTPKKLKTPISTPLRSKTKSAENSVSKLNLASKLGRWVSHKEMLIDVERQHKEKECQLKLEIIEREYQDRKRRQDEEHRKNMELKDKEDQRKEQEHQITMEIKQLQRRKLLLELN